MNPVVADYGAPRQQGQEMKVKITIQNFSSTGPQKCSFEGMADTGSIGHALVLKRFNEAGEIDAAMESKKPFTFTADKSGELTLWFHEKSQFIFSTDYFAAIHGCKSLKEFTSA